MEFGLFDAGADAEHGTGEYLQVVGKVFGPAERGEDISDGTFTVFLDLFHYG